MKEEVLIKEQLKEILLKVTSLSGWNVVREEIEILRPSSHWGDYATNLPFYLSRKEKKPPLKIAQLLRDHLQKFLEEEKKYDLIASVEIGGRGFINFVLSNSFLYRRLENIIRSSGIRFCEEEQGKKIVLEHTSPDPIKTLHLGHLRNNFIGMALSRILDFCGYQVIKDMINNDRGTHVAQAMWGYLVFARKNIHLSISEFKDFSVTDEKIKTLAQDIYWRDLLKVWLNKPQNWFIPEDLKIKSDHFDLRVYSMGARAEKLLGDDVSRQVREILKSWEKKEKGVRRLWRLIINWSTKGYEETYRILGSEHDFVWHESEIYEEGRELVLRGVEKGIFKRLEDGAVLSQLEEFNLPNVILLKTDGTTLYHTQDLILTKKKIERFKADKYLWVIGNDQKLYLQQLFSLCEQLGIGCREQFSHINYGYVRLKGVGKMSSRAGTIVSADDLLEKIKSLVREFTKEEEKVLIISLAALKYGLLKYNRADDITFDLQDSISLSGNSGPYLLYTFARIQSLLNKGNFRAEESDFVFPEAIFPEERRILLNLSRFPEIVKEVAMNYAPHLLCNFLFNLAQDFNTFYQQIPILQARDKRQKIFRLTLSLAVGKILAQGLELLNIRFLQNM